MTWFVVFVFLTFGLLIWLVGRYAHDSATLDPSIRIVQGGLTALAILLAGTWYFVERKGQSHAEVKLVVDAVRISEDFALVEVRHEIKNVGYIVLRPRLWDVQVLRVVPSTLPFAIIERAATNHWPAFVNGRETYVEGELVWGILQQFKGKLEREIEPGEMDVVVMDFVVPCWVSVARVSSAIKKADRRWDVAAIRHRLREGRWMEWWWKDRALVDVGRVCAADVGTRLKSMKA